MARIRTGLFMLVGFVSAGLALGGCSSDATSDGGLTDAGGSGGDAAGDVSADANGGDGGPDGTAADGPSSDGTLEEAGDGGAGGDATVDGPSDAANDADVALPACTAPSLGRGRAWVRANPTMLAGLDVVMPAPDAAAVSEYFDGFHATAVHTWETGLPSQIAAYAAANHPSFRYVSWTDKDGTSLANAKLLGGVAPLPGRIGYQIGDEPLSEADLQAMLAGAAALATADPDGLRIINLNDSDEANGLRTEAIQAADIDVLSYDHYTWKTSAADGLMATRNAALAAGKPYWRYVKSFHYKKDPASGTASDLRWDALVGAVYGFTGTTWFLYSIEAQSQDLAPLLFTVGGDFGAQKTALYAAAASANRELASLGKTLALLESTDVRYVASIDWLRPSSVQAFAKGAGGEPYLTAVTLGGGVDALVGVFKDDCDERYVMVQSQAHAGGVYPNASTSSQVFTLTFDFSSAQDPTLDGTKVVALDTLTDTVAPRALTSTGAKTAKLDVTLEPGAVFFFKYADARPFVRQP